MVPSGVRGVWPRPSTHARATPAPGGHRSDPRGPTRAVSGGYDLDWESTPSPGFRNPTCTKSELAYPCGNLMRTPDVAACNVVAMAGSRGAAEARPRASARTRRPSLKARAQPAECEHASKPQAAGGARRGGRAAAPEGLRLLTPAPRKRPASDGGGGDGGAAPWLQRATHRAPRLGYSERRSTRRAVKRSTARRSTAGSTAIREHAVTAVGIRTNETLQHTFKTGRRAAATRAPSSLHLLSAQQPARAVRDES